jgi:spore coat protein CotF
VVHKTEPADTQAPGQKVSGYNLQEKNMHFQGTQNASSHQYKLKNNKVHVLASLW